MNFRFHISHFIFYLLPIAWLFLFRKSIIWLYNSFFLYDNILGFVSIIVVLSIIIYKIYKSDKKLREIIKFQPTLLPLLITFISIPLYLISEYFIDLNIVSTTIFGLGTFGLVGLYIPTKTWQKGTIPAFLIILTLPFANNLDIFLGFPLRMFTTDIVYNILIKSGITTIQKETILIIENSATNIDISCSGIKGLWTGTIFFLAIVWLEQQKINLKVLLLFFLMLFLFVIFNTFRITILIFVAHVFEEPQIAELIHLPSGIIAFIFTLIIIWLILKTNIKHSTLNTQHATFNFQFSIFNFQFSKFIILIVLFLVVVGSNFLHFTKKASSSISIANKTVFPEKYIVEELQLSKQERGLFISNENDFAEKYRFEIARISGSIIISTTGNWRGHHKPEICYRADGLEISYSRTVLINENFAIMEIKFHDIDNNACYWFQADDKIVSDYSSRIWLSIIGKYNKWTMISILFDEEINIQEHKDLFIEISKEIY